VELHWTTAIRASGNASKNICNEATFATPTQGQILLARDLGRLEETFIDHRRIVIGHGVTDGKFLPVAILLRLMFSDGCSVAQQIVDC
jgi:hypothetical protein